PMTRLKKRTKPSIATMPRKARPSEPHMNCVRIKDPTTPASPTNPRWSLRSRGGRRSRSITIAPVTKSTSGGAMARRSIEGRTRAVIARRPSGRRGRTSSLGDDGDGEGGGSGRLRVPLGDEGLDARLGHAREGHRVHADPHDDGEDRQQNGPLAAGEVGQPTVGLLRDHAEDDPLIHPQEV